MPLMATFDPSGAMRDVQRIVRYRRECALPHSYAVNVAETMYNTVFHTLYHYSATSVHRPPVGGGVLDAPSVAI